MRDILLLPAALLAGATAAGWPASGRAETCGETHESCLESCHIDFGMEKERTKLVRCVKRCDDRYEDCRDLRQAERRSQFRLDSDRRRDRRPPEAVPEERRYGIDEAGVRQVREERPTDVRTLSPEEAEDDGEQGLSSSSLPPKKEPAPKKAEPAPPQSKRAGERPPAADEPPPPARKPEPAKKREEFPDKAGDDDDWAREK